MNVTREEKMAEAIERMKALRVFKPTIKQFKDDGLYQHQRAALRRVLLGRG